MSNYPPVYHTEPDEQRIFDAIDAIMHATLLVPSAEGLQVSFTPFLLDRARRVLRGHVARRNPQADAMNLRRVDVIFHGPHAYISPQVSGNDEVPTWNYLNVHVTGTASRIEDDAARWQFLVDLVHVLEGANADAYLAAKQTRLRKLLAGIAVFEVAIEKLQGRFKLGRNDTLPVQQKAFAALQRETPPSLRKWLDALAPG